MREGIEMAEFAEIVKQARKTQKEGEHAAD